MRNLPRLCYKLIPDATKPSPNPSLKNPRRLARRRRRPLRDGRTVQEDNCTDASGAPMAVGSACLDANDSACHVVNSFAHPADAINSIFGPRACLPPRPPQSMAAYS